MCRSVPDRNRAAHTPHPPPPPGRATRLARGRARARRGRARDTLNRVSRVARHLCSWQNLDGWSSVTCATASKIEKKKVVSLPQKSRSHAHNHNVPGVLCGKRESVLHLALDKRGEHPARCTPLLLAILLLLLADGAVEPRVDHRFVVRGLGALPRPRLLLCAPAAETSA